MVLRSWFDGQRHPKVEVRARFEDDPSWPVVVVEATNRGPRSVEVAGVEASFVVGVSAARSGSVTKELNASLVEFVEGPAVPRVLDVGESVRWSVGWHTFKSRLRIEYERNEPERRTGSGRFSLRPLLVALMNRPARRRAFTQPSVAVRDAARNRYVAKVTWPEPADVGGNRLSRA